MKQEEIIVTEQDEISIDLVKFFKDLLRYKWLIVSISMAFGIIGAVYSLTMVNEYTSTVKMLPEIDSKQGGGGLSGLKSLAGLAGVDLGSASGSEAIRPDLYPNILQSTPFLLTVLDQKVYVAKTKKWVLVKDLFGKESIKPTLHLGSDKEEEKKSEDDLGNIPQDAISKEAIQLNKKTDNLVNAIKSRISADIDKKSGVITISVKMTDPVAATSVATYTQNYLTNYVTKYRTQKAKTELEFLTNRKNEAKDAYDKALFNLSSYQDQNRNIFLNVARDMEKKLQYEVDVAYNIYNTISTQVEDSKIKVQRQVPVIKILEPAQVPVNKTEPKRSLITLGFLFFGLIASVVFVFFKTHNLKELFS